MIEHLSLKNFGRFVNREFRFSPGVIFYGPNESGKTTIFDALFTTLCRVPRQGEYKTGIYQRYGDAMESAIMPEELAESFEVREFVDLHSIRSGDVDLKFNDESPWALTVKNALFSGGIDPSAIADDLESRSLEGAGRKHNKEIAQRKSELSQFVQDRSRLEAERVDHAEQARKRAGLVDRLGNVDGAIAACEATIARISAVLDHEGAIQKRRELEEAQRLLDRELDLRSDLTRMPAVAPEDLALLAERDAAIVRLQAEIRSHAAEIAARDLEIRAREGERLAVEARRTAGTAVVHKAESLLGQINEFLGDAHRRLKVATSWNIPLAAGSAIVALAAVVAGALIHPAFLAGLLALAGLWFARHTDTVEDAGAMAGMCTGVRDQFRAAGGGELRSAGLQEIAEELRQVIAAHEGLAAELLRIGTDIGRLRERSDELAKDHAALTGRLEGEERSRHALLERIGVPHREALLTRAGERKALVERLDAAVADNQKRMAAAGFRDPEGYRSEIRRKLADADTGGVPREGAAPAEIQRQRNALQAEQKKKADLEKERERMNVERGYAEGKMSSMDRVLEGLVAKEKEIARLEAEIEELELTKKAAALAAGIFRTMASDAGAMLTSLAGEMQSMFEGLVALPRGVEVGGFDSSALQAMDAGGTLRGIGHLSKGTRDTLTFAARLTLALRSDPGGEKRLLVLDEPFASLDPARVANALAMVRRIQDDHGWQIVLFTKDPVLADAAVRTLKDPVRHDLV